MILRRLFGRGRRPVDAEGEQSEAAGFAPQLLKGEWKCSSCGEWHNGLMDIGARAPDPWPYARDFAPNSALNLSGDFLSEDFCVIGGQDFLIRCVLEIPVHGLEIPWRFGCWSTLKKENFERYVADFNNDSPAELDRWFGWLCNQLKGYFEGDDPIAVDVCPQSNRQRPRLFVQDADHPLAVAQKDGITHDAVLALLRAYGHGPTVQ